jgi:hypothetical protein
VGLGYGMEAYGVGKYGGPEVIVRDKKGAQWTVLGDAPSQWPLDAVPKRVRRDVSGRSLHCLRASGVSVTI